MGANVIDKRVGFRTRLDADFLTHPGERHSRTPQGLLSLPGDGQMLKQGAQCAFIAWIIHDQCFQRIDRGQGFAGVRIERGEAEDRLPPRESQPLPVGETPIDRWLIHQQMSAIVS